MNVSPTTLQAYQLTLTESEIRASLTNPKPLLELLAAAMLGAESDGLGGVKDESPKRKATRRTAIRRKARKLPALRAKAASIGQVSPGLAKVRCDLCGEEIASKYLNLHKRKKHSASQESD